MALFNNRQKKQLRHLPWWEAAHLSKKKKKRKIESARKRKLQAGRAYAVQLDTHKGEKGRLKSDMRRRKWAASTHL